MVNTMKCTKMYNPLYFIMQYIIMSNPIVVVI